MNAGHGNTRARQRCATLPSKEACQSQRAQRGERGVSGLVARGCEISGDDRSGIAEAAEAARRAEVAIVAVGGKSGLMPDCTRGEFRDAADLGLTGVQQALVRARGSERSASAKPLRAIASRVQLYTAAETCPTSYKLFSTAECW